MTGFVETGAVVQDLCRALDDDGDAKMVFAIKGHVSDVKDACMAREEEFKQLIRQATRDLEGLKQQGAEVTAQLETNKENIAVLNQAKANQKSGVEELAEAVRKKREHIGSIGEGEVKAQEIAHSQEIARLEQEHTALETKFRLFTNISSIVWDTKAADNLVKGTCHHQRGEVIPFSLSTTETSAADTANALWRLLEQGE